MNVQPRIASTDEDIHYNITFQSGSEITAVISYGDETSETWPTLVQSGDVVSTTHSFAEPGNYSSYLDASNELAESRRYFPSVIVQRPVPLLSLESSVLAVGCPSANIIFTLDRQNAGDQYPTDPLISFEIGENLDELGSRDLPFNYEASLCATLGTITVIANVSNLINDEIVSVDVLVQNSILSPSVVISSGVIEIGTQVDYEVTLSQSAPASIEIDYRDSSAVVNVAQDETRVSYSFSHAYNSEGIFTASITLANDVTDPITIEADSVTVQIPVPELVATVNAETTDVDGNTIYFVGCPTGNKVVTVDKVNSDDDDPTDISMQVSVGDNTEDDINSVLPYDYETSLCDQPGNIVINVNVSNLVNYRIASTEVLVESSIVDPVVDTVEDYVAIGWTVNYVLTLALSAKANFVVSFSDGSEPLDITEDTASTTFSFTHVYNVAGEFQASVTVSNDVSDPLTIESDSVTVQLPVPELVVTVNVETTEIDGNNMYFVGCPTGNKVVTIDKVNSGDDDPTDILMEVSVGDNTEDGISIVLPYDYEISLCDQAGNIAIIVNVSNLVSYQTANTEVFVESSIVDPVVNILEDYAAIGWTVHFVLTLTLSAKANLVVNFADDSDPLDIIEDTASTTFSFTHVYNIHGEFRASVTISNDVTDPIIIQSDYVIVQIPVPVLITTVNIQTTNIHGNEEYFIGCPSENKIITFDAFSSSDDAPSDVSIVLSVGGINEAPLSIILPYDYDISFCDHAGAVYIRANISNAISYKLTNTTVLVETSIIDPVIDIPEEYVAINSAVLYVLTLSQSAMAVIVVDFHDSSPLLHVNTSLVSYQYNFTHIFRSAGNFSATATISNTVTDPVNIESPVVVIQRPLSMLDIVADPQTISTGGRVTYTLSVSEGYTYLPDNVHMNWDFGDGSELTYAYTENFQDSGNLHYSIDHTFSVAASGEIETQVSCVNMVSSLTKITSINIEKPVTGISVSLPQVATVDEAIEITVTIASGSLVNINLHTGDDLINTWFVDTIGDDGESFIREHSFLQSGRFDIFVQASNTISSDTSEETSIQVQNPVESFIIDSHDITRVDTPINIRILLEDVVRVPTDTVISSSLDGGDTWSEDSSIDAFPFAYSVPGVQMVGMSSVSIQLRNSISRIVQHFDILAVESLGTLNIFAQAITSIGELIDMNIELTDGSSFTVIIDWGDGSELQQFIGICILFFNGTFPYS